MMAMAVAVVVVYYVCCKGKYLDAGLELGKDDIISFSRIVSYVG